MLGSLEKLILNKDKATYQEYKTVHDEILSKMFPDLWFKLHKEKITDGAKSEADMVDLLEQADILRRNFPDFDKKEQEELSLVRETLADYNQRHVALKELKNANRD